ncbi:MAG: ABC transporter ATP-binding protein [Bordetella sp.]|nr:ABC transporter ATP-binding protein [Bordetella sp.]
MLEIRDLRAAYGAVTALRGISLLVPKGHIVALLGANGAGKTTLLSAIMGRGGMSTSGSIQFQGRELRGSSTEAIVSSGIALAPEGRQLFPELTVLDNLVLGAYLRRDRAAVRSDIDSIYELFPRLAERRSQLAATLSGGEQQMVAIGRALMSKPQLLLLDEPSLGLSPRLTLEMMKLIGRIRDRGITILLIEQNARQALRVADDGLVLEHGQLVLQGEAATLLKDSHVTSAYLGGSH